jgi:hypothetical protein
MAQEIYHRSEWGNPNEQWGNVYLNADLTNELYKRASEYENSWVTDQLLNGVGTKPSIILTPTAYEDGVLNSVKPSDGNADFQFSRNSSATRVNELGLVQDVQLLSGELVQNGNFEQIGSELVTNGSFDTDSGWIKGTGWSIANGRASYDGTGGTSFIQQQDVIEVGKTYKVTLEVLANEGSGVNTIFLGGTVLNNSHLSVGSHTFYGSTNNTSVFLFIYGRSGEVFEIDNVSVKEVGQNWSFLGDFETDGTKAFITNASQYSQLTNQIGVNYLLSGNKYRLTFDIPTLSISGAFAYRYTGGSVTPILTTDIQNGKFTTDFIMPSNGYFWLQTTGSYTGLNVEVDNVSVVEITDDTDLPRINYTDGEGSLLLEPQSTNLVTYSEDFSQSVWVQGGAGLPTILSNQGTAPDGNVTADLIYGLVGEQIRFNYSYSVASYYISLYVKSNNPVSINLTDGPVNYQITTTSEWTRYMFATVTDGTGSRFGISLNEDVTTDDNLLIWGAQLEQLSYATSYIPTNGSTVTRLADVCNNSGSSDLINSTEGVLYAEISALANDGTNRAISISDNTTSNVVRFYYSVTDNRIVGNVKSSGTNVFNYNNVLTDATDFLKIAISYKANDFKMYVNGTEVSTDTSGSVPTGLNELAFDNGASADDFYGNVKCVAVFKEALSDTELQKLTTI